MQHKYGATALFRVQRLSLAAVSPAFAGKCVSNVSRIFSAIDGGSGDRCVSFDALRPLLIIHRDVRINNDPINTRSECKYENVN